MRKLLIALFCFLTFETIAQQRTVALDYFFNNEYTKNSNGTVERFHYIWEDTSINGYSIWAKHFSDRHILPTKMISAPTNKSLKEADIFIIADPDNAKEATNPNYMTAEYAATIATWVKKGGVLVMLTNDSANTDLSHFNLLANKFGMHFTDKVRNSVIKDISVGKIMVPTPHDIFKTAKTLYLKGISTIEVQSPAKMEVEDKGDIIMASAKYGKGTVFAIGDPWIYNEYIVNYRLNDTFQNGIAAIEFTDWLIAQIPAKSKK
jgi:unsaturated rhamnogalacturonyl hydrolase